mmetsp:Transcript_30002/g.80578  ORF Transcript_30002/g.80578 Transcript_30002/m.80578 type:complete len:406 (-) Transcript_30002:823-2040(-)
MASKVTVVIDLVGDDSPPQSSRAENRVVDLLDDSPPPAGAGGALVKKTTGGCPSRQPSAASTALDPGGGDPIDLLPDDDVVDASGAELVIDLSTDTPGGNADEQEDAKARICAVDLTSDDQTLARQLQRAFDGVDLTSLDAGADDRFDLLLAYRNSIDAFLRDTASRSVAAFRVREVFHNPHSQPGTPLYERFYANYKNCKDKTIRLVFHGTAEKNIDSILRNSLDPKRRGVHGQAYGKGEYFAEDVALSLQYCQGGRKMLVFAVLMDDSGRRNVAERDDIIVVHKPGHHLPLAVVSMEQSANAALTSGRAAVLAQLGLFGSGAPPGLSSAVMNGLLAQLQAGAPGPGLPVIPPLPPSARVSVRRAPPLPPPPRLRAPPGSKRSTRPGSSHSLSPGRSPKRGRGR